MKWKNGGGDCFYSVCGCLFFALILISNAFSQLSLNTVMSVNICLCVIPLKATVQSSILLLNCFQ